MTQNFSDVNFNTLWDLSDLQSQAYIEDRPDGIADQVGAGVDLGQALLYRGGQSVAEAFGFADSSFGRAMVEGKEDNLNKVKQVVANPLYEDGEFSFRGLLDQVARGVGTLGVALPAAGAGLVAPLVGVSGSTGALVAGGLMSGTMQVGDIGLKAEDMDEAYTASLSDIGTGYAMGAIEPIVASKFVKALTPAIRSTSPEIIKGIRAGNREALASSYRSAAAARPSAGQVIGSAVASSAATEGLQDFGSTLAAVNTTSYWDEFDVEDAMKESATEALIGGILGLPFGVGSSVMTKAAANNDLSLAKKVEDGMIVFDERANEGLGGWRQLQEKVPVTNGKLAHLYSKYLAPVLGEAGSKAMNEIPSETTQSIIGDFNQTTGSFGRRAGQTTVNFVASKFKAKYSSSIDSYMTLSRESAQRVHDHRVMPSATKEQRQAKQDAFSQLTKEEKKGANQLATFLDQQILNDVKKAGIGGGFIEGGNYFPLHGRLNYKKIKQNPEGFVKEALETAKRDGITLEEKKVRAYIRRIEEQGYEHFGVEADAKLLMDYEEEVTELISDGMSAEEAQAKASKALTNRLGKGQASKGVKVNSQNAVETHRALSELPQDFWSNWVDPNVGVQESVYSYYEMLAERMAHAEKFGANNEKFYTRLTTAVNEARESGKPFNAKRYIADMTDLMNLSQRIPKFTIDPSMEGVRTAQNVVRAGLNVALLPLAFLSSMAEVFVVGSRTGNQGKVITKAGSLTARIVKEQFKHGRGLSFNDARKLVNDTDIIGDLGITAYELKNTAAARMSDNEIGGKVSDIENKFYNMTLTPQWTEALRMTAAIMAEQGFKADLELYQKAVAEGNLEEQLRIADKFAEAGLNIFEASNWYRKGAGDDAYYRDTFRMGVLNVVEDTVMRPRMSQKPAWMADERFKLLGQLKSFAIVFNNVVMKGWYNQMVANGTSEDKLNQALRIAPYIGMMIATQIMSAALREFAKTGDIEKWEDRDALGHVLGAITYIGGIGFVADPLRASNWGVDPVTVLLGPAAGKFNDTVNGIGAILSGNLSPDEVVMGVLKDVSRGFPIIAGLTNEAMQ